MVRNTRQTQFDCPFDRFSFQNELTYADLTILQKPSLYSSATLGRPRHGEMKRVMEPSIYAQVLLLKQFITSNMYVKSILFLFQLINRLISHVVRHLRPRWRNKSIHRIWFSALPGTPTCQFRIRAKSIDFHRRPFFRLNQTASQVKRWVFD